MDFNFYAVAFFATIGHVTVASAIAWTFVKGPRHVLGTLKGIMS
jgi:hypothetical protein